MNHHTDRDGLSHLEGDTTRRDRGLPDDLPRIGPYRLLHKLGEGGMGQVFEAEQLRPVRRRVALKIIKLGMDTQQVLARFESERQALALMNHPNIARVYDVGATDEGRPYFAMEVVQGVPLDQYCDGNRLGPRQRLELIIQICDGVQHAHQKGVIHRDLKPSNVLVTEQDGRRVPKIIDFGIAKATAAPLTDKTLFTALGQVVGTPEYMSPEQADESRLDVDTRADVYQIGVMLYNLLTGELPFDTGELRKIGFNQFRQKIIHDDPPKPSTRVMTRSRTREQSAKNRRTDPRGLHRTLRGELDWITMKALEKDRTRRYASVSELAADIRRYLTHEPVLAGAPSAAYRMRKFLRRHRVGASFGIVLVLLLAGFAVTMSVQARRIATERDRAEREATSAREVSDFLQGLFAISDPSESLGETITAREILQRGADTIRSDLGGQPEIQARMMNTIGLVHAGLGLTGPARELIEEGLRLRTEHFPGDELAIAESLEALAGLLPFVGETERARELYEQVLEIRRRNLGAEHPDVAASMNNLAGAHFGLGETDLAADYYARALRIWEREGDQTRIATVLNNQAALLMLKGQSSAARPLYERVLRILSGAEGPDPGFVARAHDNLGRVLQAEGKLDLARPHLEQALKIRQRIFGDEHGLVAGSLAALAMLSAREGDRDRAEQIYTRAITVLEAAKGFDNPFLVYDLASCQALIGERDEALRHLRRAVVDLGYANAEQLRGDPNLASLREEPEFGRILDAVASR